MTRDAVRDRRQRGWLTFVVTSGILGVVGVMIVLLPVAKRYIDEHGLQLPSPTKLVLEARWHLLLHALSLWSVLLLNVALNRPRASLAVGRVGLVIAFALAGAVVMSIAMPLIKLHEGLSK